MSETTNTINQFRYELSDYDRGRLSAAAAGIDAGYGAVGGPGVDRYAFYRRHGHSIKDSLAYALAWAKNAVEQYERRLGHDTGAQGWREV